jgi:hypothetical protein
MTDRTRCSAAQNRPQRRLQFWMPERIPQPQRFAGHDRLAGQRHLSHLTSVRMYTISGMLFQI